MLCLMLSRRLIAPCLLRHRAWSSALGSTSCCAKLCCTRKSTTSATLVQLTCCSPPFGLYAGLGAALVSLGQRSTSCCAVLCCAWSITSSGAMQQQHEQQHAQKLGRKHMQQRKQQPTVPPCLPLRLLFLFGKAQGSALMLLLKRRRWQRRRQYWSGCLGRGSISWDHQQQQCLITQVRHTHTTCRHQQRRQRRQQRCQHSTPVVREVH